MTDPSLVSSPPPDPAPGGDAPMLFGGLSDYPSPEVFAKVRRIWSPEQKIWRATYEKFMEDPKHKGHYPDLAGTGATLEQIWNYSTLVGRNTYCVLARPLPHEQTETIRRLERCSPGQLVSDLRRLSDRYKEFDITALATDGHFGHCIYLRAFSSDSNRIIYHDPWPARSLFCKDNNKAGVDAQPESAPEGELGLIARWSITSIEFEKIVVACIVAPAYWACIKGIEWTLGYDSWSHSEFFNFFHVRLLKEDAEDGVKERWFTTGPFENCVLIIVSTLENGTIGSAKLVIDRIWMREHMIMVLDLAKSFIATFTPPPDKGHYDRLCELLPRVTDPSFVSSIEQQDESRMLLAFIGFQESAEKITDFAVLRIENLVRGDKMYLELAFDFG